MKMLTFLPALLLLAMAVPAPSVSSASPRVFAHYMPWFYAEPTPNGIVWDHWQWYGKGRKHDPDVILDNGRRDIASVFYPLIGPYNGQDAAVIEYHMLTAKAAGIEGFIADWYGPGNYTDLVFGRMVEAAERYGMEVAICLEEKTFSSDYTKVDSREEMLDVMERQVRHVLETHATSPGYLRLHGRPVFFIFNAYGSGALGSLNLSPDEFRNVLSRFDPENVLLVRGWHDPNFFGVADGSYLWITGAKDRLAYYESAMPARREGRVNLVVGGPNPGFDDSGVNGWGKGPRITDRRGTQEYRDTWDEALRFRPDAVQIATWNDFQEGTTIEPAEEYGFTFLDLTEQYVERYTGRAADTADNRWPLRLYRLRLRVAAMDRPDAREQWNARLDRWADDFASGRRFLMSWRLKWLEWRVPRLPPENAAGEAATG